VRDLRAGPTNQNEMPGSSASDACASVAAPAVAATTTSMYVQRMPCLTRRTAHLLSEKRNVTMCSPCSGALASV
jgi:hypothetical protein